MRWLIDGNNVMGAGADGWWNDPPAAAAALTQEIALWCRRREDSDPDDLVTIVFDGRPVPAVEALAGANLAVEFAPRPKRDAADDRIVELVTEMFVDSEVTVVTSDKGLVARLPPGVEALASGRFRRIHLGLKR